MAFGGFSGFNIGGFEEGRQLAGPNALGVFVKGLTDRISQMQTLQFQNQMAQQMFSRLGNTTAGAGVGANTTPGMGTSPFTPQYGITGASIDPLNPSATRYTYGETPQSQMQRDIVTKGVLAQQERQLGVQNFAKFADNIKQNVARVKTLPAQSGPFGLQMNPNAPIGALRESLGTADLDYAAANAAINQSLIPFLTGVEGATAGRVSQSELMYLGNTIRQLPKLPESERQLRYQQMDNLLVKYGLTPVFTSGDQISSSSGNDPLGLR